MAILIVLLLLVTAAILNSLIPLQILMILISININVLLILQTKFQLNLPSCSGENGYFNSFVTFSNGSHLEFSTRLIFFYSEALESDHAAYKI